MKIKFNAIDFKGKARKVVIILVQTIVISGITILSAAPLSCRVSTSGIEIVGGDYSAPVLQEVNVLNEKSVTINFSEAVTLETYVVSPILPEISDSDEHTFSEELSPSIFAATGGYGSVECDVEISADNKSLQFNFKQPTEIGQHYEILGVVKDRIGNSLTFTVPFTGYNGRIPEIIMTELHTGMASQTKAEKTENIRRLEYIEFLALTDGNLIGLELCSGCYGETKKYVFPAVEVKAGEYFVLHMRSWGNGCISEEGDDITTAFSEYTSSNVRDLWVEETAKCIGDKTDIIVLKNLVTDKIVDAVMYRDESIENWSEKLKTDFSSDESIIEVYTSGADIENATIATGLSSTYALVRANKDEIYNLIICGEEIKYPVSVESESWIITKPTLPLKY